MCDEMDWKAEAMRFRAERDQARQEYERFEAQRDQARQELYRARQDLKNARVELCSALGIDPDTGWSDAMSEMGRRLMPEGMEWPRYEDGEPVKFGDAFRDHQGNTRSVLTVKIWQEGGFEIGTGQGTYDWHSASERVKRPAPKVLDADGVEIRVGDTVWCEACGGPLTVESIDQDGTVLTKNGMMCMQHTGDDLTHERPDSWERLESDATMHPETYCVKRGIDIKDVNGTHLVLDEVTERMARDLVRRAKALADRGL